MPAAKTYKIYAITDIGGNVRYVGRTSREVKLRISEHKGHGEARLREWLRNNEHGYMVMHETTDRLESIRLECEAITDYSLRIEGLFNRYSTHRTREYRERLAARANRPAGTPSTYANGRKRHNWKKVWLVPVKQQNQAA